MFSAPGSDDHLFLSTQPAGAKERRAALAIVIVSAAIFVMIAPFAKVPLPPLPTFVAVYQSALVVNDLITAAFLFTQFGIVRSRSILLLASAYLFTALMATAHALTFPGLFSPTGLLGAGPQSTAWLYMFWHAGFPFLVLAYTWTHPRERPDESRNMCDRNAVLLCLAATTVAAGGLVLLATHGQTLLPAIMQSHNYTSAMTMVIASVWALSVAALFAVWRRRPHSVLDLWLLVVLCAWTFDIALSAMLNAGRFDLGFYAGRIYGLIAAGLMLVVLLIENGVVYAQLVATHQRNLAQAAELLRLTSVDGLTGIANRRAFENALDQEWRRTLRHGTPLCLLMIDVDCFKRFNDTYGHVAGDECLRAVAGVLARSARRAGELAARYGGEEFAVLLPHCDLSSAMVLANRICSEVRGLSIEHRNSTAATCVTISIGVASALQALDARADSAEWSDEEGAPGRPYTVPTILVEMADRALYKAKTTGRDRACAAPDETSGDGSSTKDLSLRSDAPTAGDASAPPRAPIGEPEPIVG